MLCVEGRTKIGSAISERIRSALTRKPAAGSSTRFKRFLANTSGNTSMVFIMTLVPTVAFMGMMTDFGRAYTTKTQLTTALDAAALVGGRTFDATGNMAASTAAARTYFYKVLPKNIKASLSSVKADSKGNVTLAAKTAMGTTFLGVLGVNNLNVQSQVKSLAADTQTGGGISGKNVEIALVMDVTGSMADNNKLVNAKLAATALVNTLMPASGASANSVRISIVPFSEYVNVGAFAPAATNTPVSSTTTSSCTQTKTVANYSNALCTQPVGYVPDQNNTPRDKNGYDQHGYKLNGNCGNGYGGGNGNGNGNSCGDDHDQNSSNRVRNWSYVQQDVDSQGYDHYGYDQYGYDKNGWDIHGCDKSGTFHGNAGEDQQQWYGYAAYDRLQYQWNNSAGKYLDQHGFDQNGFDANGHDVNGFDQNGYDTQTGNDHHGCDHSGVFQAPVAKNYIALPQCQHSGYDLHGYDQNGYDHDGYDRNGCDHGGKDRSGNQVYNNPYVQGNAPGYAPITSTPPAQVSSQYACSGYSNTTQNPYPYKTTTIATTCSTTSYLQSCMAERLASTGHAYDDAPPSSAYFHPFKTTNAASQLTCSAPAVAMTPLTNSKATLLAAINALTAAGGTSGHIGTAWGWYTLSPNWANFWTAQVGATAAPAPVAPNLLKIAIIMTDGGYNLHYDNNYNQVNDDSAANSSTLGNGLSRTQALSVCTNMKAAGIEVFTVGVEVAANVNDGKASDAAAVQTLQSCSSNVDANFPTHFYNVVNNQDPQTGLVATFQSLANQIAVATGTGNMRLRVSQ